MQFNEVMKIEKYIQSRAWNFYRSIQAKDKESHIKLTSFSQQQNFRQSTIKIEPTGIVKHDR